MQTIRDGLLSQKISPVPRPTSGRPLSSVHHTGSSTLQTDYSRRNTGLTFRTGQFPLACKFPTHIIYHLLTTHFTPHYIGSLPHHPPQPIHTRSSILRYLFLSTFWLLPSPGSSVPGSCPVVADSPVHSRMLNSRRMTPPRLIERDSRHPSD